MDITTENHEDTVVPRVDRCITDALVKLSGGTIIGGGVSILFLRNRLWPIFVGCGVGLGIAISRCEASLNDFKTVKQRNRESEIS